MSGFIVDLCDYCHEGIPKDKVKYKKCNHKHPYVGEYKQFNTFHGNVSK